MFDGTIKLNAGVSYNYDRVLYKYNEVEGNMSIGEMTVDSVYTKSASSSFSESNPYIIPFWTGCVLREGMSQAELKRIAQEVCVAVDNANGGNSELPIVLEIPDYK